MEQKLNKLMHAENLRLLDGCFYHGTYYRRGVGQVPKEKQPKPVENPIFNMKGEIIFNEPRKINL